MAEPQPARAPLHSSPSLLPTPAASAGLPARPPPPSAPSANARPRSTEPYRPLPNESRAPVPSTGSRYSSPAVSAPVQASMHGNSSAMAGPSMTSRSRWDAKALNGLHQPTANGNGSASPPTGPSLSSSNIPNGPRRRSNASAMDVPRYSTGVPVAGPSHSGFASPRLPAPPTGPAASRSRDPIAFKMQNGASAGFARAPPAGPAALRRPPHTSAPPPDPFFYKLLGTKDYKVQYDPDTDSSSVKQGKEMVYRYDGAGVEGVEDPRKSSGSEAAQRLIKVKARASQPLYTVSYPWDKNSTGPPPPPPPSGVLVTGYPGSTTADSIRSFFANYGRIETLEARMDRKTGGSLGICWIKYVDDVPRASEVDRAVKEKYEREKRNGTAQDGNKVALDAVKRGNGQRIGSGMIYSAAPGVKVQLDGTGVLSKKAAEAEMERRHPKSTSTSSSSKPPAPPATAAPSVPSGPRPPPPPPQTSQPPPPPPPSNQASSFPPPPSRPLHSHQSSSVNGLSHPNGPKHSRSASATLNGTLPLPPHQHRLPPRQRSNGSLYTSANSMPLTNGSSSSRALPNPSGYRGHVPGAQANPVAAAVAQAVLDAKKRLEEKQATMNGEEDMELDSDEERAVATSAPSTRSPVETKKDGLSTRTELRERFFFHADGRIEPFKGLHKGQAPANAIAWQASRTVLMEKLAANGMPYISISRAQYDEQRMDKAKGKALALKGDDLESHFAAFDIDRTFADRSGWYLTFHSPGAAQKAYETLHQKPFAGAPLDLTLCSSESAAPPSAPAPAPPKPATDYETVMERLKMNGPPKKKTSGWTDVELVEEAREIVIGDLIDAFRKDVKDRVVSCKITEHVALWEQGGSKTSSTSKDEAAEPGSPVKSLASLPSFSRKKGRQASSSSQRRPSLPSNGRLSSETPSESPAPTFYPSESESEAQARVHPTRKHDEKARRGSTSTKRSARPDSESDDRAGAPISKKRSRSTAQISYTSSEGEGEAKSGRQPPVASTSRTASTRPIDLPPVAAVPPPTVNGVKPLAISALAAAASMAATPPPGSPLSPRNGPAPPRNAAIPPPRKPLAFGSTSSISRCMFSSAQNFPPPPPHVRPISVDQNVEVEIDPNDPRILAKEAAFRKKRLAKHRAKRLAAAGEAVEADDGDVEDEMLTEKEEQALQEAWEAKKERALDRKAAERAAKARIPKFTPDPFEKGVAADEEDLYYVKLALERFKAGESMHPTPPPSDDDERAPPKRHPTGAARTEGHYNVTVAEKMANRPMSGRAKAVLEGATGDSGVAVSRLARANTRGLVRGMELHKKVMATDTDVLKFNQLRTRKKQLTFSRSGIEGYGLFACEQILAGEMVIEYVGELIRQQVADRREKAYERQGIGSSYLFRVDEDLVVDATKKGNLGRLINHCCVPNCTAKIITINGVKKIVIYAKTNIEPDDEVTYDYHFAWEEEKIPCLCGHPMCRKYLN